ncbi:hypothetical protein B7463_g12724, partial [Scytalidium lignicola]
MATMQGGIPTPSPTPKAILSLELKPPLPEGECTGEGVVDCVELLDDWDVGITVEEVVGMAIRRQVRLVSNLGSSGVILDSPVCGDVVVVEGCVAEIAASPALTSAVEGTARASKFPVHALETIDAASVTAAAPQFWPMH